jgi:hypothetical protein
MSDHHADDKPLDRTRIHAFLRTHGTKRLTHPGGTLYEHLDRVCTLLASWGADEPLQAAGLCHACYGTDGFAHAILDLTNRDTLIHLIGHDAEALVYLYCSCDRKAVYPLLEGSGAVAVRDRFTGRTHTPTERELRAFLELTAANELDALAHNDTLLAQHRTDLLALFTKTRNRLSKPAWHACANLLDR